MRYFIFGVNASELIDKEDYDPEIWSQVHFGATTYDPTTQDVKEILDFCIGWNEYREVTKEVFLILTDRKNNQ